MTSPFIAPFLESLPQPGLFQDSSAGFFVREVKISQELPPGQIENDKPQTSYPFKNLPAKPKLRTAEPGDQCLQEDGTRVRVRGCVVHGVLENFAWCLRILGQGCCAFFVLGYLTGPYPS